MLIWGRRCSTPLNSVQRLTVLTFCAQWMGLTALLKGITDQSRIEQLITGGVAGMQYHGIPRKADLQMTLNDLQNHFQLSWVYHCILVKNKHEWLLNDSFIFFFPFQSHLQSGSTSSSSPRTITSSRTTTYDSISSSAVCASSEDKDTPNPSFQFHPVLAVCVAVVASFICVAVAVGPTLMPQTPRVSKLNIKTAYVELSWIWCVIVLSAFYPVSTICIKRYLSKKKQNHNNNFVTRKDQT